MSRSSLPGSSLAFALVGLGASVAAAYVHYQLLADPTYTSFCDVNATVSCTQVYASRFGTVVRHPGRDLRRDLVRAPRCCSLGGMVGAPGRSGRASPATCSRCSTLGARRGALPRLRVVCDPEGCSASCAWSTYAAVIGLFLISGAATSVPMTTLPRRAVQRSASARRRSPLAIALAVLFVGGRGVDAGVLPARSAAPPRRPPARHAAAAADGATQRSGVRAVHGSAQPRCRWSSRPTARRCWSSSSTTFSARRARKSYVAYKPILAKYAGEQPGAVQLVHEDYPAQRRVQRERPRRCTRRRARPRWRCGSRARAQPRPRRWKSGSTRTSRR